MSAPVAGRELDALHCGAAGCGRGGAMTPRERRRATPGPWAYNAERGIVATTVPAYEVNEGDDPAPHLTVIATRGAMGGEDTRADIRLICAAPDLLTALEECAADLEAEINDRYCVSTRPATELHPARRIHYERDMAPVVRAREVIRRATVEGE